MTCLPLLRGYGADAVFAHREGRAIIIGEFLHDVAQLAALLPGRRYVLNLCTDRYHFVVGFAAALLREQVSLLPPNHTAELIEQLRRQYADVYCLTDACPDHLASDHPTPDHSTPKRPASEHPALETVFYPQSMEGASPPPIAAFPATQTAAIVFTSGSTGLPLPHPKSWGGLIGSARAGAERLSIAAQPAMAIVGTVPPQHMYGLESTLLMALQHGMAIHAGRTFYPADICAALESLPRPRGLVTTPVHLRALLAQTAAVPGVDLLLCATAPLSPQLAAQAEARFGAPLYEIYGCTEAGQVATRRTVESAEWRALRGIVLRQDERGTWAAGGHVEAEVLLADVIELRETDKFFLHGRTADLVNIAGKRTSLANLNYHLNSIDGVRDGVFVMPDDGAAAVTRLMAFVVAPDLTPKSLLNALRRRIDAVFLPRPLCFVLTLPRDPTGKLPRRVVDELVVELAGKAH